MATPTKNNTLELPPSGNQSMGLHSPSRSQQSHNKSHTVNPVQRLVVVGPTSLYDDRDLRTDLEQFGLPFHYSSDGSPYLEDESAAFVLTDFEGPAYERLFAKDLTLFGRTAIKEMARDGSSLAISPRPLFSTSMRGVVICFNEGYRDKECKNDLKRFLFWIHSMGGRIAKDVAQPRPKVTHLVARNCKGDKYTYATTFDIPVMQDGWIKGAWERRKTAGFSASQDPEFVKKWTVKPFHGASVFFLGFSEEEKRHMIAELKRNGGRECRDYLAEVCTHIVVENNSVETMPSDVPREVYVVKVEWFWASIQMDACAEEKMHLFADYICSILSPRAQMATSTNGLNTSNNTSGLFSPNTPGSHGRRKKRRTEAVRQLAQSDGGQLLAATANGGVIPGSEAGGSSATANALAVPSTSKKARSSLSELNALDSPAAGGLGLSSTPSRGDTLEHGGSFISDSPSGKGMRTPRGDRKRGTPGKKKSPAPQPPSGGNLLSPKVNVDIGSMSARQQVFAELVQTEENYVSILRTILEVFKQPLEGDDPKMKLLNQTELKIIFGQVPPIFEVHSAMLKEFTAILRDWRESVCVGAVFLKYAPDLLKAYPPFVNFFENMKKTLEECDKTNPRFHAFLKVCQSRRECGRQTLGELLIRPVQRLGSISLLLNDLLKHTKKEKDHPDVGQLQSALEKIKAVLTNINEDKRKTEGQVHIFEIFSEIENCPPHLVSSNRNFLCKADVIELGGSDELSGKGAELTLHLFSDVLEISKKRGKHANQRSGLGSKSPSTISLRQSGAATMSTQNQFQGPGQTRAHKHIDLMSLTAIRRVVDLIDGEDCNDCFTLVCRTNQELKERMFVFQIVSEDMSKAEFLKLLTRNVANTMYRPDPDTYLVAMHPDDIGLAPSDLSVGHRAMFGLNKVKKVFSFKTTPTSSRLTRAVSSIISPLTASNSMNRQYSRSRISSTPTGEAGSALNHHQSCVNLAAASLAESPRSSKGGRRFSRGQMPPPPPSPAKSIGSLASQGSDAEGSSPQKKGMFTLPRTPTCVRRASFKFITNSLGKKVPN